MRILTLSMCLFVAAGAARLDAELIDRVLATVGARVITLSDARAVARLGLLDLTGETDPIQAAVQRLIDRTLILEEVERYAPPEPSAAAIDAGVGAVRARFGSAADLQAAIAAGGIDDRAVREWVRNDLRIDQYLIQRFAGAMEPTPDELERYIAEHAAELDPAGRGAEDPDVQRTARERVMAVRREALVREWLEGLRRRADIAVNGPVSTR